VFDKSSLGWPLRYLDVEAKAGLKKTYFNANILQVFDEHYTKKA